MKNFSYAILIIFIILLNISFSYANIPEIVLNQKRAVVTIYVNDKDGKQIGTGSGFIIDSNGIIATNYHVMSMFLKADNKLLIKTENGAYFPLSSVVNYDEENDAAIFKIDGKELPKVKIAKNYKPKQGESIAVIGSPLGLETTVSDGIISGIRGKDGIIQITAPISPGSSGSPVFNLKGEVIGIAFSNIGGREGGQSLNFAIPVKHITNLLKGTSEPKKKEIVDSPIPVKTPAPTYMGLTAEEWWNKAFPALWDGNQYTDPEKAIEYCNNAIKLAPDYGAPYNSRGLAYKQLGQQSRAIQDFTEAIRLMPDYTYAYGNRGIAYKNLGMYQQAIEDYNEAIRLSPNDGSAYSNRAIVYFLKGNNNLGCSDAQKACAMGACNSLEWARDNRYCQ